MNKTQILEALKGTPLTEQDRSVPPKLRVPTDGKMSLKASVVAALKKLTPPKMLRYYEQRIQGQGKELKKAVYCVYRFLKNIADGNNVPADKWVLTAPSGSGKTEFYRATYDLFKLYGINVPVAQIDLSLITEQGFKGQNPTQMLVPIVEQNEDCGGTAIVFLDEADKKCVPSYSGHGSDVNKAVLCNLLTMIEGCADCLVEGSDHNYTIDTNKTMFVFMGAFQDLRKAPEFPTKQVGFGVELSERRDTSESIYRPLTIEDIIRFGMPEELAGRMTQVINFRRLSEADMLKLLRSKTSEISENFGYDIKLTKQAAEELLSISFTELGLRKPVNRIKELAQNTVSSVFFERGFSMKNERLVIDDATSAHIEKVSRPAIRRSREERL